MNTQTKGGCIIINYNVSKNSERAMVYEGRAQYVRASDGSIHNFFHFNTLVCKGGYNDFILVIKDRLKSYFGSDFKYYEFDYISIDDYNIQYNS